VLTYIKFISSNLFLKTVMAKKILDTVIKNTLSFIKKKKLNNQIK